MNRYALLILIGIALIIASCVQNGKSTNERTGLTVYFYYRPTCPWCRSVEPYMKLLKKEGVSVVFCDTTNFSECSQASKKIANESSLAGVPTVVVVRHGKIIKKFEGAYEVAEIGRFLKKYGYNVTTNYTISGVRYTVKDCVKCHVLKGLPPPSSYSCSSCCH